MKVERFVIEYANYVMKRIENSLMQDEEKTELMRKIDKAVWARGQNLVSADEAIMMIGGFERKE